MGISHLGLVSPLSLAFRQLGEADLAILRGWFVDEELARRLSYPTDDWFTHVTGTGEARSWISLSGNEPIAAIQVDGSAGGTGHLAILMRPELRGRGWGSSVLLAFLAGPGRAYQMLIGSIEPDNVASLACCRRCGFVLSTELDEDGLIEATYNPLDALP